MKDACARTVSPVLGPRPAEPPDAPRFACYRHLLRYTEAGGDARRGNADVVIPDSDNPREACGVFGVFAPGEDVARLTFYGLYALQHRGQESAGIASSDGKLIYTHKSMGHVAEIFTATVLNGLPGYMPWPTNKYFS